MKRILGNFKKTICVFLTMSLVFSFMIVPNVFVYAEEMSKIDYDTSKNILTGATVTRTTTAPTVDAATANCGILIQPSASSETASENATILDGSITNTAYCHSITASSGNNASFRIKFSDEKNVKQIVLTTRKANNGTGLLSDSTTPEFSYASSSNSWWNDNGFTKASVSVSSVEYSKNGNFKRTVITLDQAVKGKDFKLYIPRDNQLYINEIEMYEDGNIAYPYPSEFSFSGGSFSAVEGVKLSASASDFTGAAFNSVSFYNAADNSLIANGSADASSFTATASLPAGSYSIYAKGTSKFGEYTTQSVSVSVKDAEYDFSKNVFSNGTLFTTGTTNGWNSVITKGDGNVLSLYPGQSQNTEAQMSTLTDGKIIGEGSPVLNASTSQSENDGIRMQFESAKAIKRFVITTKSKIGEADTTLKGINGTIKAGYLLTEPTSYSSHSSTELTSTVKEYTFTYGIYNYKRTVIDIANPQYARWYAIYNVDRTNLTNLTEVEAYEDNTANTMPILKDGIEASFDGANAQLSSPSSDIFGNPISSVVFFNASDNTQIGVASEASGKYTYTMVSPAKATHSVYAVVKNAAGYAYKTSVVSFNAFSGFLATINSCKLEDNGTVTYSASIQNNSGSSAPENTVAVFALYDEGVNLVKINSYPLILQNGASKVFNETIGTNLTQSAYKLKMFVWTSDTLTPLAENDFATATKEADLLLAESFPALPFNITKNSPKCYSISGKDLHRSPVDAKSVFSEADLTLNLSSDSSKGISVTEALSEIKNCKNLNNCEINIVDNIFTDDLNNIISELNGKNCNVLIQGAGNSGFSWLGKLTDCNFEYTDGVYSCTPAEGTNKYLFPVNLSSTDSNGIPHPYTLASSQNDCKTTYGTFFYDSSRWYVNPFPGESISDIRLLRSWSMAKFDGYTGKKVVINNLGLFGGCYKLNFVDTSTSLYVFNSKFYRGVSNAFEVSGKYSAYVINCVAAYPSKDGFNYHSASSDSLVAEINCTAYGCGVNMLSGVSPKSNENASTAHDAIKIVRVGGKYENCNGPIVADVHNTYSISIGCRSDISNSNISFQYASDDTSSALATASYIQPKYIIDCFGGCTTGLHLDNSSRENTCVLDFDGSINTSTGVKYITWKDLLSD